MPPFCDPLSECKDIDGKLLMQRAVYGPQLAFDPGVISVGGIASRGSALRPLVHLKFEVRWRAVGLCHGVPTSVMGLAPGEVVTVGLRTRSVRTFSSLVREAAERTVSSSRTDRETRTGSEGIGFPGLGAAAGGLGDLIGGIAGAVAGAAQSAGASATNAAEAAARAAVELAGKAEKQAARLNQRREEAEEEAIELIAKFVGKFGSIFEDAVGAVGGAIAGGVAGAVGVVSDIAGSAGNAVADLVDNVVGGVAGGGPAAALLGSLQQISEVIETVERSESESSLRETTVTTTTESEQTITRTFGNPYLDRSLQLRFIPVFQRFEVTTRPVSGIAGLATIVAEPDEPASTPAMTLPPNFGRAVAGGALSAVALRPSIKAALGAASKSGAESNLRVAMLSTVQKAMQASGVARGVRLDQGLSWDRTRTLGNAVHVPLATGDIVSSAWGLNTRVAERLQDALGRLNPDALQRLVPRPSVRVVHVFAGLHVEAVPGSCVLPDIPAHLRVVVPGGTQYAVTPPAKPE